MAHFLLLVVAAMLVAAIGYGIVAFTMGRDRGLTPPRPDGAPFDLPPDRPLTGEDVRDLRLDTAVRGYRMGQVDVALERVRHDLDVLWRHAAALEDEIAELRRATAPPRPSSNGSGRPPAPPGSGVRPRDASGLPGSAVPDRGPDAVFDADPPDVVRHDIVPPAVRPEVVERAGPLGPTPDPRRHGTW